MSILINNGLSGLLAAQRGLETTANNVSNAGTEGYVRQRVEFAERGGQVLASGLAVGNGVSVNAIRRVYDRFLADGLNQATSSEQRARLYSDLATRVDQSLGNPETGIGGSLQRFFDQAEALNRDPSSAVNRRQLLAEGESLTQRFAQLDGQLGQVGKEVDARLRDSVNRVNALAESLAQINAQVTEARKVPSNDLLNRQDQVLRELSEMLDLTVNRRPSGAVNVLFGSGQPLVLEGDSFDLQIVANEFDGLRAEVGYQGRAVSEAISGGAIGGLIAFRGEVLDQARRDLGRVAMGLAEVVNAQHAQGMDQNGDLGGAFFAAIGPTTATGDRNTGTAAIAAVIADPANVQARDYELSFDGTSWQVADVATGAPVAFTGTGGAGDPLVFEGLEITVTGAPAARDRFLVSPVGRAPAQLAMAIRDPAKIAAASPLTTTASLGNLGSGAIGPASVADLDDPNLLRSTTIVFDDPATFRIVDGGGNDLSGPLAYVSGDPISFDGWTTRIDGPVAAGDRFDVRRAAAGSGDNGNALALAGLGADGFFDNGRVSLNELSAGVVANVGTAASRASQELSVQGALRQQAELDLEAVAGVNLEEEAVDLLRYQEAYQAASKIIGIANELFQTLLAAVR